MNRKFKLNPNVIGVKGYKLDLENIKLIKTINTDYFLKNYKISNIWWGKWIIKRLINRVFKRRIHQKMIWDKSFWNNIEVKLAKTEIPNDKYLNTKELELQIKPEVKKRRFKDIKNFQNNLAKGTKYPPPLYITGQSLNYLGGEINTDLLFILDGSRRITAHILNRNNQEIILIDMKNI